MGTLNELLDSKQWTFDNLKLLLEHDSSSINEIDATGFAPLHRLLKIHTDKCTLNIVKLLIQHGANVNLKDATRGSPLTIALAHRMDKTIIKTLLDAGIDHREFDHSVLCVALYYGNSTETFWMLVNEGFPLKGCSLHPTILHCALESKHRTADEGLIKTLLDNCKDVDLNILNHYQQSLLCLALTRCKGVAIAKMLIDAGCLTNVCARHPSIWICATSYSSKLTSDVVELIANMEHDNDLQLTNELGENPLMMALKYGKYELDAISRMLHYLPERVWNAGSCLGDSILHAAVSNQYADPAVIGMLVNKGADVNAENRNRDTPLHVAVSYEACTPDIVKALTLNGSLINAKNVFSQTPLIKGMVRGLHSRALQMLFYAGARTDNEPGWCYTMLQFGLREYGREDEENFQCLKLVLKYALLNDPELEVKNLLRSMWAQDALIGFADECRTEILEKLGVEFSPNLTLLQCLQEPFQIRTIHYPYYILDPHDAHQMCNVLCENRIHVYLDDVAARIGRSTLTSSYLHSVYTVVPLKKGVKKIQLNYESILHVATFLTNDVDILRLSLAFHNRYVAPPMNGFFMFW